MHGVYSDNYHADCLFKTAEEIHVICSFNVNLYIMASPEEKQERIKSLKPPAVTSFRGDADLHE